jgi:DNA-binding MarR family transcriptional regulator
MKATTEEIKTLRERLAALLYVPQYDPDTMVTASDLAKHMGVTVEIATGDLEKLVKAGRLEKIEVRLPSGKRGNAYVEPEK